MIPKIFHFVWLGGNVPKLTINYINSFKYYNKEYKIYIWTDQNIGELLDDWPEIRDKAFYKAKYLCQCADIIRLLALYKYGGFYIDADVECVKNFDDLLDNKVVVGLQEYAPPDNRYMICNAVIGAEKNSEFILDYINNILTHLTNDRTSIGPKLLTKLVIKHNIKPFSRKTFYPFMWWERQNYNIPEESYTNHHWWGN